MIVKFTKMHSLGNDFVMLDLITQKLRLHSAHIRRIADRNLGIGCDQVITIEPPIRKDSDFFYRNFNSDGHEAEQCGNGARCAARFVLDSGLSCKPKLYADCIAGSISLLVKNRNYISVNMGQARSIDLNKKIMVDGKELTVHLISVGNPHIITLVNDINSINVRKLGAMLSTSNLFPHGANVSFVKLIDQSRLLLKVYERGAGETLACGSAACASVVASHHLSLVHDKVEVGFAYGKLEVSIHSSNGNIYLAGPTTSVFSGHFRL